MLKKKKKLLHVKITKGQQRLKTPTTKRVPDTTKNQLFELFLVRVLVFVKITPLGVVVFFFFYKKKNKKKKKKI
jgi:hypothetical protein